MATTSPETPDLLKFANLQMAAEAFLNKDGTKRYSGDDLIKALVEVNNHVSKFTPAQAADFEQHWVVRDQEPDTNTGFSGTLFECIKDDPATGAKVGELVMSFRSTEFIDDAVRDNQATNVEEIKEHGWAFGQLDDLEQWYQTSLKDHIKPDQPGGSRKLTVTGYSLGGHLATAFNLLHQSDYDVTIQNVVTFNGAGVGTIGNDPADAGQLKDMLQTFHDRRSGGLGGGSLLSTASGQQAYLASAYSLGAGTPANDIDVAKSCPVTGYGGDEGNGWRRRSRGSDRGISNTSANPTS